VESGLSSYAGEEDIFTELAKSFVRGNVVDDTAEALFCASRKTQLDQERFFQEAEIKQDDIKVSLKCRSEDEHKGNESDVSLPLSGIQKTFDFFQVPSLSGQEILRKGIKPLR